MSTHLLDLHCSPEVPELAQVLHESTVCLDTNILLSFFQMEAEATNEWMKVLKKIKEYLWIPHQVALEYVRLVDNSAKTKSDGIREALLSTFSTGQKEDDLRKKLAGYKVVNEDEITAFLGLLTCSTICPSRRRQRQNS